MHLTQGLHRSLQRFSEKTALIHVGVAEERKYVFREVVEKVSKISAWLQNNQIQKGDRVAVLSPNNDYLILVILACWWHGAVCCPLNMRWSRHEIEQALQDAEPALLVYDRSLESVAQEPVHARATALFDLQTLIAQADALTGVDDQRCSPETLACILFTGGTTGRAKGVMLRHDNLWSACMARAAELNSHCDAVSLMVAPLFHVAGLGRLVGQLIIGGCCVTMEQFRPVDVQAAIHQHQINDTIFVPTMLQAMLDAPTFNAAQVASLQRIGFGAAPMPPELLERALATWPQAEFFQAYGMTETAGAACINLPHNHRDPQARARGLHRSVGRSGLGSEMRIANALGQALPPGEVGEVQVRGPIVMAGYWRQPEATAQALDNGWLKTGDAGYLDADGYLFIVDRLKDMVITGGENVYCTEVEAALCAHPAVSMAAVVGKPHPHWGEAVHAFVVLKADAGQVHAQTLMDWCRSRMAAYKTPRSIDFMAQLPTSAAGKILKNRLREQVASASAMT